MKATRTFNVVPHLPPRLEPLREMAYNLWFSWNPEVVNLFNWLDTGLWHESNFNPVLMLSLLSQERINEAIKDESFLAQMDRVYDEFDRYLNPSHAYSFRMKSAKVGLGL